MARMGDWRLNKDEELQLDGIGGVNILVKADVHRSGLLNPVLKTLADITRYQLSLLCIRKSSRNRRIRQNGQTCRLSSRWFTQLRCLGEHNLEICRDRANMFQHIDTEEKPGNAG